jgi:hypothetical protein
VRDDGLYIHHVLDCLHRIERYCQDGKQAMWLFVCVYYLSLFGPLLLLPIVWSKMFSLQKSAFAMTEV